MKDIGESFLKILCIIMISVFIVVYALYGFRVWCWNFVHSSALQGKWTFKIPNQSLDSDNKKNIGHMKG